LLLCVRNVENQDKCVNADSLYDSSFFMTEEYPIPFKEYEFVEDNSSYAGQGHFSVVHKRQLVTGELVAVKEIRIFSKRSLVKEIQTLLAINETSNTLKIVGLTGNESHPTVIYKYHSSTPNSYVNMSLKDFKWWLREIIKALESIHSRGVIHRDVNLGNVLCDLEKREVTLIDFGLSEFYRPSIARNHKSGCIRFKAPELVAEKMNFDCAIDIWSLGICCLDIILGMKGNWEAKDSEQVKWLIESYFGKQWYRYARKNRIRPFVGNGDIFELAMPGTYSLINEQTIDLVMKMLTVDPKYRITASQALKHPLFDDVD
jgi:casein kinase II subunit alpha